MKKIVVHVGETEDFSSEALELLNTFSTVKMQNIAASEVRQALEDCDVFWFRLGFRITATELSGNLRCRWIVCPVTGIDHIDTNLCSKLGIEVLSLRGETDFLRSVVATAEFTLAGTLALMRRIPQASRSVLAGSWNRDAYKGTEILNRKVGIVGVGRLGQIVSGYFKALGAKVYGYDKQPFDESICTRIATVEELVSFVDIVTIHLSYQADTHHFFTNRLLNLMRPTAILINTSRGAIIKSEDLVAALTNKQIAGAVLDVLENEPFIVENPLLNYASANQNLLITPHIGGNTVESFEKTELFMVEKLKAKLSGGI